MARSVVCLNLPAYWRPAPSDPAPNAISGHGKGMAGLSARPHERLDSSPARRGIKDTLEQGRICVRRFGFGRQKVRSCHGQ